MLVQLWMTEEVVTVSGSQSLAEAEQLLSANNLRRIPVVEEQRVIGIVCDTDIIKAKPSILDPGDAEIEAERSSQLPVEQIMTDNPVMIAVDAPIEEAVLKMRQHKINSIPVVRDGLLVGIITETNIFNAFLAVMGAEAEGVRIEMLVERGNTHFYKMLEVFKQHGMELISIATCPDYSKGHKIVTVKTKGDSLDALLDGLWAKKIKVNRVVDM